MFRIALGAAVVLAVGAVTPLATGATPSLPGTVLTPAHTSGFQTSDAPLVTTPVGALMPDMTIRPTSDPSKHISVSTSDVTALKNGVLDALSYEPGVPWNPPTTDDAVVLTTSSSTSVPQSLTRINLSDGTTSSVPVTGLPGNWTLFGATESGYVVTSDAASVTTWLYRPFAGGTDVIPNLTDFVAVEATGSAGVVYLGYNVVPDPAKPGSTARDYVLRLVNGDGSQPQTLADFGIVRDVTTLFGVSVAMSGHSVAWYRSDNGDLGYDLVGSPAETTIFQVLGDAPQLAVVDGSVFITDYTLNQSWSWQPSTSTTTATPWTLSVTPTLVFPSATTDGTPTFDWAANLDSAGDIAWEQWIPGSAATTTVLPLLPYDSEIQDAVGTNSNLLIVGATSTGTSGWDYALSGTTLKPRFFDKYVATGFGELQAASGDRTAVFEQRGNNVVIVLRDGATVTGRYKPYAWVNELSMSGPLTAYALADGRAGILGPDGGLVRFLGRNIIHVSQDGTHTAYSTKDGRLWVLDDNAPTSSKNPMQLAGPCRSTSPNQCRPFVTLVGPYVLSSEYVVSQQQQTFDWVHNKRLLNPDGVLVDVSGSTLLETGCVNATSSGYEWVCTQQIGAKAKDVHPLFQVPITIDTPFLLAGHHIVWPGTPSTIVPTTATQLNLAPLPKADDAVRPPRLLGEWASTGAAASLSKASWQPQFTVSEPLRSWTLVIKDSSQHTIHTWHGSAATGEVSGVTWNGRDQQGRKVGTGTYHWALTGRGPTGSVVGSTWAGAVTGNVTLSP